jgi:hypothetical protein
VGGAPGEQAVHPLAAIQSLKKSRLRKNGFSPSNSSAAAATRAAPLTVRSEQMTALSSRKT